MKRATAIDNLKSLSMATWVAVAIVAAGIFLRVVQYVLNRSVWMDEASLALNIIDRSFVGLTQPLSYNQGAPIGFLFAQKFVTQIFGVGEHALRLFPFVASIAALLVMYNVAQRFLKTAGMLVALTLFAICNWLTFFGSQAKQYSSDVFTTLFLLLLAYRCLESMVPPRRYVALTVSGVIAAWLSHPALFILAGVGAALAYDYLRAPSRQRLRRLGIIFGIWGLNIAIIYLAALRLLSANAVLLDYWRVAFMPMRIDQAPAWVLYAFLSIFTDNIGLGSQLLAIVGFVLFVLGGVSILIRDRPQGLILITPFLVTLFASALQKYPFGGRLLLFLVPITLLLIGEGVAYTYTLMSNIRPSIAAGLTLMLAGLLIYSPMLQAYRLLTNPDMGDDIRPVIAYMQQRKLKTDRIYVYYGALSAFLYYARIYEMGPTDYHAGVVSRQEPARYIEDLDTLPRRGRLWAVFSHNCDWCVVDEEPFLLQHLGTMSTVVDEFHTSGAAVYLYRFDPAQR